jgi:hypothetical protein
MWGPFDIVPGSFEYALNGIVEEHLDLVSPPLPRRRRDSVPGRPPCPR